MNPVRKDNAAKKRSFKKNIKLIKARPKTTKFSKGVKKKTRVGILSLGCPRNIVDSELILSRLNLNNFEIVDIENCQIAIVNTCSFIREACEESIDRILDLIELKKQGVIRKIIVAGCLPARYKSELVSSLPEVDAVLGTLKLAQDADFSRQPLTPPHYRYIKISEGCLNNCSYCTIPAIKGGLKSRTVESVIKEIELFDKQFVKEINIIGQDISQYGVDLYGKLSLSGLLTRICRRTNNIKWIRLLYLHPRRLTKPLIKVIAEEPKICKYIDLPLQHINDRILKRMNRKISKKEIIELIYRVRGNIPGVAIRTAFIVGFPGETEQQFKELLDFVKEMRFERLGAFIYSREEGTRAFNFKEQIPPGLKRQRFDLLMKTQQSVAESHCREALGAMKEVIIDERCEDSQDAYIGRTRHDAPEVDGGVFVKAKRLKIGDIINVKITGSLEYDLIGEKV